LVGDHTKPPTGGIARPLIGLFVCLAAALALPAAASAAQTFGNPTPITINDGNCSMGIQMPADVYPSPIAVSGAPTAIDDVDVAITGFGHMDPADVRVLVAGPAPAQPVLLMHGAGGSAPVTGTTEIFDDAATGSVPTPIVSGTYKPTRTTNECSNFTANTALPAPALPGPYAATLSSLNGINPNGIWNLYVADAFSGGTGQITGGWSLAISASNPPAPSPPGAMPVIPMKKCKKKHKHRAVSAKKCKKRK
jgi:hypothetical protein